MTKSPAIERFRAMLSAPGSTLTASMLRDLENGCPIEADHIVGFMLEKARAHGMNDGMPPSVTRECQIAAI